MRKYSPPPGWTLAAYRFALDLTPGQERDLASHCGAARFAYNWAVSWVRAVWDQRVAEASYGVPVRELTPWRPWSLACLRKVWNQLKGEIAPWWGKNSKEAYNTGLANAAAAFDNYKASRNGRRAGATMGKPRRKRKHSAGLSCRFTTGAIRLEPDRGHVTLPRLGTLKTHESTRKLARRLEAGTARILSATVSHRAGRWFVAFQVEVKRADPGAARPDTVIGVDLGITHLAVLLQPIPGVTDDHGFVANPRHLDAAQRTLRRACRRVSRRRGPDRRSGQRPSNRWRKANRERNRRHHRVANLRLDGLHKLSTGLAGYAGTVVVEDLNVAGMLRNKRLARHIADAGWSTLRRMLAYKTGRRGGTLYVADRWFASSKTCSDCSAVKAKLPLHIRAFHCDECGLILDRDLNAARNLARLAQAVESGYRSGRTPAAHGLETDVEPTVRPGPAWQVAEKRPPRTGQPGKTGTVRRQRRTANWMR